MKTVERARGRWREILLALGVDRQYLTGKHGPCPLCRGKNRYRFSDKDGDGWYICNQCGAGTGLILLRKLHGWDHKTACDEVDKVIGSDPLPATSRSPHPSPASRLADLERVLSEATSQDIAKTYLASRGLSVFPAVLRGHRALPYIEDGKRIGRCSAMLAPVTGADGSLQSVHRTYIADVPERKKTMPVVESLKGAAVRLFDNADVLGIAEGIETAIAAHELFNVPTWSVLNTSVMESFTPPESVTKLLIFADNDVNFAGQKAAYTLANRLVIKHKIAVEVHVPPGPGSDWLDVLNGHRRAA